MAIKMIAFDLDGTALDDKKTMTPRTKSALEKAVEQGIEIVPATGRAFCGVPEIVTSLKGVRYVLTSNGAAVYEIKTGKCIYENNMPLAQTLPLMEKLEPLEIMADAFVEGLCYMKKKNQCLIERIDVSAEMKDYLVNSRICVENVTEFLREKGADIEKLSILFAKNPDGTFQNKDEVIAILKEFPEFIFVSGGLDNIEVTVKSASKGDAVIKLGKILNIQREEIMAFGDSGNDLEMIRAAGVGVAMENAEREIKEAADVITRSNVEDGMAHTIETMVFTAH